MFLWNNLLGGYVPLAKFNDRESEDQDEASEKTAFVKTRRWMNASAAIILALTCFTIGFVGNELIQHRGSLKSAKTTSTRCAGLSRRREWRSLSTAEKIDYINAVQCLTTKPSKKLPQDTLYDDLAYVHIDTGIESYSAAAFLPYHRYLIAVYEDVLKNACGFKGALPYWDWTLDWENLEASPVFANTTGFGTLVNRCITDGPFSDIRLPFYGVEHPGCIWRLLPSSSSDGVRVLSRDAFHPATVESALGKQTYEEFYRALDIGSDIRIPNGIAGTFLEFTAANDPLFFLHHSQLDRLWWLWQQSDSNARDVEYYGLNGVSGKPVTLNDVISLGELAPDVRVEEVMNTKSGALCYQY